MTDTRPAQVHGISREAQSWLLLVLIVAVGTFLRFHLLGVRSLWTSECFSVLVAHQPFPQFLRTMWWGEGNMAFYYLLLRGWVLFGDSEAWLQGLSALFGVLTIPAVYELGKRFLDRNVGLVAAALLAVNSSHVGYSENVRCYSLWLLLTVLSTYCFLALLESPQRKALWLLYILCAVLLIYTQVFGVFFLGAQWLAVAFRIRRLGIWKILTTLVAIGILSVPMAIVILTQNKGQLAWIPPVSLAGFWKVFRSIVGTDLLGAHDLPAIAIFTALYIVAWIAAIWGSFRPGSSRTGETDAGTVVTVLTWWLVFPLIAFTAISFAKPILFPRYLSMCLPAAVLLAGQGLVTIDRRVPRGRLVFSAALVVMTALALVGAQRFDSTLRMSGDDWRGVSNYILQHQEPGDAVIFYPFRGNWTWDFYVARAREASVNAVAPTSLFPPSFDRVGIENSTAPYHRVWVVRQQDIPTPETDASNALLVRTMAEHFREIDKREFAGKSMFPGLDASIHLALYSASSPGNSP